MLLRQQGRRHQDGDLFCIAGGKEGRAHGHFCFTESDIATNQAIHYPRASHIVNDRVDCRLLVRGFLKGKGGRKLLIVVLERSECEAFPGFPPGVNLQ